MDDKTGRICECGVSHDQPMPLEAPETPEKAPLPRWRQRSLLKDTTGAVKLPERPER